jgi:hypothetical protein
VITHGYQAWLSGMVIGHGYGKLNPPHKPCDDAGIARERVKKSNKGGDCLCPLVPADAGTQALPRSRPADLAKAGFPRPRE